MNEYIKTSERRIFEVGGSKAITLPKDWVKFQEWLRKKRLTEVYCVMNNVIILAPPEMKDEITQLLERYERDKETMNDETKEDK